MLNAKSSSSISENVSLQTLAASLLKCPTQRVIQMPLARSVLRICSLSLLLLAGKSLTEAHMSLLPFLRGGFIVVASAPKRRKSAGTQQKSDSCPNPPTSLPLGHLQQWLQIQGKKLQSETHKQWTQIHSHWEREWSKLASTLGNFLPTNSQTVTTSQHLDKVLYSFKSVLRNGRELETAALIQACRAHLTLMKSGGPTLHLVAKDMESNLDKVEAVFHPIQSQNQGKLLTSLLEIERQSGMHQGNVLRDQSAAMGLLWIRRSLAFQLDLYLALSGKERAPSEAAMDAYERHLLPFHGWMLQKIFPMSLSQMPDRQVFIAKFGGRSVEDVDEEFEKDIVKKLKELVATWEPLINVWKEEFERLDMEDARRV